MMVSRSFVALRIVILAISVGEFSSNAVALRLSASRSALGSLSNSVGNKLRGVITGKSESRELKMERERDEKEKITHQFLNEEKIDEDELLFAADRREVDRLKAQAFHRLIDEDRNDAYEVQKLCAAMKIQALHRGNIAREDIKQDEDSITKIQSLHRGNKARTVAQELREKKAEENAAATRIQAAYRGHEAQRELKTQRDTATKIQNAWRGKQAREELEKRMEVEKVEKENAAATKIQAFHRGNQGRRAAQKLQDHKDREEQMKTLRNQIRILRYQIQRKERRESLDRRIDLDKKLSKWDQLSRQFGLRDGEDASATESTTEDAEKMSEKPKTECSKSTTPIDYQPDIIDHLSTDQEIETRSLETFSTQYRKMVDEFAADRIFDDHQDDARIFAKMLREEKIHEDDDPRKYIILYNKFASERGWPLRV